MSTPPPCGTCATSRPACKGRGGRPAGLRRTVAGRWRGLRLLAAHCGGPGGGYASSQRTVAGRWRGLRLLAAHCAGPGGGYASLRDVFLPPRQKGDAATGPVGPLAAPARRRNLQPRAALERAALVRAALVRAALVRAALGLDLRAVPAPQRVEGALLVDALVGVRSEEVALALGKRGRKTIGAEAVVVGEG